MPPQNYLAMLLIWTVVPLPRLGAEEAVSEGRAAPPVSLLAPDGLEGWRVTNFGGEGDVTVREGVLRLEPGSPLTGVTYAGSEALPKCDYELHLQARRVSGNDFFCAVTFPYQESHASLIVGGWGGGLIGISSLAGDDASENETSRYRNFEAGRWYRIRLRVTEGQLDAWIDDQQVVKCRIGGRRVSTRAEVDLSRPLGVASFDTRAEIKDFRLVRLATP